MNCKGVESRLSAYLDGELTGEEMLEMRAHLGRCAGCAREMADFRQLKLLLGGATEPEPESEFEGRLVAHVFSQRPTRSPARAALPYALLATLVASLGFALLANRPATKATPFEARSETPYDLDMQSDQAFYAGTDPLRTSAPIVPASYGGK